MHSLVKDLMTTPVVTVGPATPFKEIVARLTQHNVSAMPMVDDTGLVLGVVSGADLLLKEEHPTPRATSRWYGPAGGGPSMTTVEEHWGEQGYGGRGPAGRARPRRVRTLVAMLRALGYRVVGPTVREGALFGYAVGPHSWKRFLFPPRTRLWRTEQGPDGMKAPQEPPEPAPPRYAFLGVRAASWPPSPSRTASCSAAATATRCTTPARRAPSWSRSTAHPGGHLLLRLHGYRSRVTGGFDLALTELAGHGRHVFVTEVGSGRGAEVLAALPSRPATAAEVAAAERVTRQAADRMGRRLDTADIHQLSTSKP
jgi:hypothetical protein